MRSFSKKMISYPQLLYYSPVVQSFIFTRYPLPGRRIRTLDGPAVHLHSLSASRKAYPDPEWSRRSFSLAICRQEAAPEPRVVQPFIFTRYPPPGRRLRIPGGPAVHLQSLSAARKAYRDPEWSSRSSSLAIRCQEGVSGPRVVQAFIFTRCPLPGRRIQTTSGPGVYPHSLSAARKVFPDPEWSSRSSSLAIRRQEGVSGPPVVHPVIFSCYPPPGGRFRTATSPGVHLRSSVRLQEGVYGPEGPICVGGGYLATVQAFWANSTPGPRLCIMPNSAPDASQSINTHITRRLSALRAPPLITRLSVRVAAADIPT